MGRFHEEEASGPSGKDRLMLSSTETRDPNYLGHLGQRQREAGLSWLGQRRLKANTRARGGMGSDLALDRERRVRQVSKYCPSHHASSLELTVLFDSHKLFYK